MTFDFTDTFPKDLSLEAILISGSDSTSLNLHTYLIVKNSDPTISLYEIRHQFYSSPFEQAMIIDNFLAVGYEEYFYLFNRLTNTNALRLKMDGYFGNFYHEDDLFYVADAGGLYCIDKSGLIRWHNNNLGMDGVIIDHFTEHQILGSGEWDPPGGWRDFILDKATGNKKEVNGS